MHLPHPSLLIQNLKTSTGRTALSLATQNILTPPSTFSTLTSATFRVLDIIFNLWNTTSPLLNLIFSSLQHSCLRQLTVPSYFLFSNFRSKAG
ncbi:hypothetical protein E2C01_065780 [Portunus trituberculatus]|uniref:Uncharacterized protein n=1 Tax=Portunus trituberculatus TaxID=210409 RepID=A0A5B7HFH8_PORTR|nr:hypothetical protein [Portunus trituberculatus]